MRKSFLIGAALLGASLTPATARSAYVIYLPDAPALQGVAPRRESEFSQMMHALSGMTFGQAMQFVAAMRGEAPQLPLLPSTESLPAMAGQFGVYGDEPVYRGSSGAMYKYDLSRPMDRLRYEVDPMTQLRDSMSIDPRVELDRGMGQFGGGAMR